LIQKRAASIWSLAEEKLKKKKLRFLQQNAAALGYKLLCAS
jgi:hypothetical protein